MKSSYIRLEDLRPGMVFVDAARPTQRLVILKPVPDDRRVWMVKIGVWTPYCTRTLAFHATKLTAHGKVRKTEYYLDPDIPGNVPEHLRELHGW